MCVLYVLNSFQLLLTGNILCAFSAISPLTRTKMCQRAGARMVPTVSSTFTYHKIFNNSTMAKHHQAAKQTWTYSSQAKAWGRGTLVPCCCSFISPRDITFAMVHLVVLTPFFVDQELNFYFLRFVWLCHQEGQHFHENFGPFSHL